jgi:hypothetical protein
MQWFTTLCCSWEGLRKCCALLHFLSFVHPLAFLVFMHLMMCIIGTLCFSVVICLFTLLQCSDDSTIFLAVDSCIPLESSVCLHSE